jgi:hypothetical protein
MGYRIKGKFASKEDFEAYERQQRAWLPDVIADTLASESDEVDAMVKRVNAALEERAAYERAKSPSGSHIELRKVLGAFYNARTAAAFFVALKVDPDLMFNRSRKEGTRANLKGFTKVRKLIDFVTGRTKVFERVSLALFASTIIAARMGVEWIASPEQELILSKESVQSLPTPIQEAISEYKHKHMTLTGDSRPQACQFRTTFQNLGIFEFYRDEFDNVDYTLGITVNMDSPLVDYLTKTFHLDRFN